MKRFDFMYIRVFYFGIFDLIINGYVDFIECVF